MDTPETTQAVTLRRLLDEGRRSDHPLVFAVPGSGLSAISAVRGGIPFLIVLNSGVYRMAGVSSQASFMPYGNANRQVASLIRTQILPRCPEIPLVAGVLTGDPTESRTACFDRLHELGVAGVINWPPVSMNEGAFLEGLRRRGFCEEEEAAMLVEARQAGFVTFGFAASDTGARILSAAQPDAMVINVGWTLHDSRPLEKQDRIQYAIRHTNRLLEELPREGRPVTFFYGGGITSPQDTLHLYQQTEVDGFGAGSAIEYFPVRDLIQGISHEFLHISKHKSVTQDLERIHPNCVGSSPAMLALYQKVRRIAGFDVSVSIEGESGSGKEVVATMLHGLSSRAMQPFITMNCGAIPDTLVESEFFGHEKGAFTGATERRLGKFELANHGTLFLDEVAELSPKAQVCLLRALQQREIVRVGGRKTIPVDVRILTATNRSLRDLVAQGTFRADLFFRLSTTSLHVPPLRERLQDIDVLARHFLAHCRQELGCPATDLSKAFLSRLKHYNWPGNVRELAHIITEAAIMEDGPLLAGYTFAPETNAEASVPDPEQALLLRINNALREAGGNKSRAASLLGISRKTLYKWLGH